MFTITLNNQSLNYDHPITASTLIANDKSVYGIIFNQKVYGIDHIINEDGNLSFIHAQDTDGKLIYTRTLDFILIHAVKTIFNKDVRIMHSIAHGQYITINDHFVKAEDIALLDAYIQELITKKVPILHHLVTREEASQFFHDKGMIDTAMLIAKRESAKCSIYQLENSYGYFYGVLLPNTAYIDHYQLKQYDGGIWLSINDTPFKPQDKLLSIFKRFEKQAFDQQVANIPDINKIIENNQYATLVMQDEKRLKDDVSDMIDLFLADKTKRVILMSGPSSSGKTTLTKNIQQQLLHHGHDTLALSLDDFFLERDQTPLLPDGSYDFENITCIDLNLFNDCINSLLNGKAYHLPIFDFIKGQKIFAKEAITLHPDQILLIEGLHALNPKTSQHIPSKYIFKVYINALTHLNLDNHNYISTSDYRMIRRMTRDIQYRNQSIQDTIRQWPKVKDGENKYIYPYQEDANYIINTSMCYEMPIFRKVLIPLLLEVDKKSPEYITAQRIKRILSFFCPGEPSIIPDDSILKEFIGF